MALVSRSNDSRSTASRNPRRTTTAFGVDIGGSGIKGAMVDLGRGDLATERVKYLTPNPSTPEAVGDVVARLVREAGWTGDLGATFPAVIKHGVALSAANVDPSWIGTDVDKIFSDITGCHVTVLNDADAAGLAEVRYGAAKGVDGVVILLTFGTGIGSALLMDGKLVPNTELGHLELDGNDAEKRASSAVKDNEGLSYKQWAKRVQRYLAHVEKLFTPDLFVLGGGVSKSADKWVPLLNIRTPIKPAQLLNNAGIVGAALAAHEKFAP
jgi:polyphosphate glucokinase